MSSRIKHLVTVGAAIAVLLSSEQAAAQQWDCDPCPSLCGDWEIGAHALYLAPIACPYGYASAFVSTLSPNLTNINAEAEVISCPADWGFHVFGNYLNDCLFASLSYQWFEVTTTRAVTADNLHIQWGQNIGTGRATGQVGIEYQYVDVRVGQHLLQGCGSALYFYGNVRWVDLSHRRMARITFTNEISEDARQKSQLKGGALGIGFGGESDIWCGVGAFIDGNILGVIGERSIKDIRYRQSVPGTVTDLRESYPSETCVIPEVDFRIGVNYTYVCGCWELVGEIGYEVDYFWHASMFPDITNPTPPFGLREFVPICQDLGFSGLFFGGHLVF